MAMELNKATFLVLIKGISFREPNCDIISNFGNSLVICLITGRELDYHLALYLEEGLQIKFNLVNKKCLAL